MTIKLTYWSIRALGEPIRHILRYQNEDWEDNALQPTGGSFREYVRMRDEEDMPFGNLPFIEDDGKKITQSITIMRYLGRKFGLYPAGPEELVLCEVVEQEIYDLRNRLTAACYDYYSARGPFPASEKGVFDHEFMKRALLRRLKERIPKFEKTLTKKFLLGDKPVYVDFLLYEYLDQLRQFLPEAFTSCNNVLNYLLRFKKLPNLKEWFESEEYKRGNYINAPHAEWNGID